jgi:hypothetical protein
VDISGFDDLLMAARAQPEPQRLLFVFAGAELPDDATPEQRARFEQGAGGALVPLMCVDKAIEELTTFDALVIESHEMGQAWQIVFAAALSGTGGRALASEDAKEPLKRMEDAIRRGAFDNYIPFDHHGQPVIFG